MAVSKKNMFCLITLSGRGSREACRHARERRTLRQEQEVRARTRWSIAAATARGCPSSSPASSERPPCTQSKALEVEAEYGRVPYYVVRILHAYPASLLTLSLSRYLSLFVPPFLRRGTVAQSSLLLGSSGGDHDAAAEGVTTATTRSFGHLLPH
jgi:hypothetical protein